MKKPEPTATKNLIKKGPPQLTLPPKTTEQEDLITEGQRKINMIWEMTQSKIALFVIYTGISVNVVVIVAFIVVCLIGVIKQIDPVIIVQITAALASINLTTGIVIGFYFSRTNHSAIGGVGKKPQQSDQGTR